MNRLVAVPAVGRPEVHAFTAADWTRGEQMFRRAARHSRFIRVLRVAVPVGAMASVAVLAAIAYFNPFKTPDMTLDTGTLVVSGRKVGMEQPRLTGYTKDALPYELTARLASQDLAQPGVLELNDLRANIQTKDQGKIEISAKTGVYTVKADQLQLVDDILVQTTVGYEARLEQALIDMKKGTIVSDRPVRATFPQGSIESNRLEISESGSVILFSQGVKTVLVLPPQPSVATGAASP